MTEEFKVQGIATLRMEPRGHALYVLGSLENGKLLCKKKGATHVEEYDPDDLYVFATGPVDRPPQKA